MDASKRGQLLYKLADLIERDLDYLAVSEIMLCDVHPYMLLTLLYNSTIYSRL